MAAMGAYGRLRARISILVAIGAVLVAVGVALLLGNTVSLRNTADSTINLNGYLLRAVTVERLVVDEETGLRGYVITGRQLFLQPLRNASPQLPAAEGALLSAAVANHAFVAQAKALVSSVGSYDSVYLPSVLGLASHNLPAASSFAVTLRGKNRVDDIRGRAATLEHLISARLANRERTARTSASHSIDEAVVVLVLLTLLTAVLGGVLGHLAVERERARERSEATSKILQQSLLPSSLPAIPGCELAARFIPAAGLVGGDFYDAFEVASGRWALIVGDVTGKGPTAAALTAMVRWRLRTLLEAGAEPADALRVLNDAMVRHELDGRFATVACMRFTIEADSARAEIGCAGHPAPIITPRAGAPMAVIAEGDLLGLTPAIRLRTTELTLHRGDSLVAYTDGVTDQGPQTHGSPEEALSRFEGEADAEQIAGALEQLSSEFVGRQRDDVAILALRFVGCSVANSEPPVLAAPMPRGQGD